MRDGKTTVTSVSWDIARAFGLPGAARRHCAQPGMQRLKRVFAIENEQCRRCGGRLEVIANIEDPALIERIPAHVRQRGEEDLPLPLGARAPRHCCSDHCDGWHLPDVSALGGGVGCAL